MKDTFSSVFPTYNHGEPSITEKNKPLAHDTYTHHQRNDLGRPMHKINKEHYYVKDAVKEYSDSMFTVKSMRRVFRWN